MTGVSNLFDIFHWVMSIGSEAMVIEPGELIEMVKTEALKIFEIYNNIFNESN
jgi:predicted DNA-binding transcriptional regulator YafY